MLSFVNDYSQGAHEAILNRLLQINPETIARGYGADHYCESAKEKSARLVRVRRQMFFPDWRDPDQRSGHCRTAGRL